MNRKQRRAAAAAAATTTTENSPPPPASADEIPMAQPDRSGPKAKTLYEYAAEREAELSAQAAAANAKLHAQRHSATPTTGTHRTIDDNNNNNDDDDISTLSVLGTALFLGTSLTMLHFTLDVLVYQQYRQTIEWREIGQRTRTAAPMLLVLVWAMHVRLARRVEALRQAVFFAAACGAGCFLVYSGNRYQYFAVMKMAPPVGTLWVWSVIEMGLEWAVPSLVVVAGYVWWNGFTVF